MQQTSTNSISNPTAFWLIFSEIIQCTQCVVTDIKCTDDRGSEVQCYNNHYKSRQVKFCLYFISTGLSGSYDSILNWIKNWHFNVHTCAIPDGASRAGDHGRGTLRTVVARYAWPIVWVVHCRCGDGAGGPSLTEVASITLAWKMELCPVILLLWHCQSVTFFWKV